MMSYKMGNLNFSLSGDDLVTNEIKYELGENLEAADEDVILSYEVVDKLPKKDLRLNGNISVGENCLRINCAGYICQIEENDNALHLTLENQRPVSYRTGIKKNLKKVKDWNYLAPHETTAKNFMYDIFDWSTQISQLKKGQSYIHASSMTKDDKGIAILGWGGVGKTTSLLKFCLAENWHFLSDDLGIIDTKGRLYKTPKRIQIYGYNIEGQPAIKDALCSKMSLINRLMWEYRLHKYGGKQVRRRISANDLFSPTKTDSIDLTDIIYLEKSTDKKPVLMEMDTNDIAKRMAAIVMAEIEPYSKLHREAEAAGVSMLQSPAELQEKAYAVLQKAFSGKKAALIRVGDSANPNALTDLIKSNI